MVDVAMNATVLNSTGYGLMNLSTQTGTVGTAFGVALLVGIVTAAIYATHEFHVKGSWVRRFIEWLNNVGIFKALIGIWSLFVLGSAYVFAQWFGSGEGSSFLVEFAKTAGIAVLGFAGLVALGHLTEPIWSFIYDYALNRKKVKTHG